MQKKLITITILLFFIIVLRLGFIILIDNDHYKRLLNTKIDKKVYGYDAPRGRILDINGKVIVDNKKINTIFYHKEIGISFEDEINVAKILKNYLELNQTIDETILKEYWLINNKKLGESLITANEYRLYDERKLNNSDILKLKYERITEDMTSTIDEKEAYIYHLMNNGYQYSSKIIITNLSEELFAQILEMDLPGIVCSYTWERYYPYEDTMRNVLGNIASVPKSELSNYLDKGYQLSDIVGISALEKQYEEFLRGKKAIYKVIDNNRLELLSKEEPGNDLMLSIDIDKQVHIESILKEKIKAAKREANTNYYKESYVIVSDPTTGAIVSMAGKRLLNNGSWQDVSTNIINNSFTMGSVVKGATIAVGYQNKIIDIGTKMTDSCVKLYLVPQKCSFKRLGVVDDLKALMNSSNYYQFRIAIGLTNNKYSYNMKLDVNEKHFQIYRNTLASFGLGTLSNIDLPKEENGLIGKTIASDLLLNLAIGQYDTYTPIQVLTYINTIANGGSKYKPQLMNKILNKDELVLVNNYDYTSKVDLEEKYIKQIQKGMNLVLTKGTGRGHVNYDLSPAGKTGTSESLYDSDNDNVGDVKTITKVFAGFIPYENPKYSVVVISPNVSYDNPRYSYTSSVNRHISREVTDFLFEK